MVACSNVMEVSYVTVFDLYAAACHLANYEGTNPITDTNQSKIVL
jgi:hypothetical protein